MDIDTAFATHCEFGRKQKTIVYIISIFSAFLAIQQVHNVFMGAIPHTFKCEENINGLIRKDYKDDVCDSECALYKFPNNYTSIVTEWQLVCDESSKGPAVQSAYMFGILWGSYAVGELADRYGRRHLLYISVFSMYALTLLGSISPNYTVYIVIRHFVGVFAAGFCLVSYVLAVEICGNSKREMIAVLMPLTFALGIVLYAFLAYFIRQWRILTIATALPGLATFYFYYHIPESPRWLYSQGRVQEAEHVLQSFCSSATVNIRLRLTDTSETKKQGFIFDLFRNKYLFKWTVINIFVWCVNCMVYYGLILSSGNLGNDMYTSVALSGVIEIPAYVITFFILDRLGRRISMSYSMLLSGVCCVLIFYVPGEYVYSIIGLALFGKMMISISFSIAYIYVTELYPTILRNKAMGICGMSARFGGIFAPILVSLGLKYKDLDFLIFGCLSAAAGFATLLLPETAGRPMPEDYNDIELLAKTGRSLPQQLDAGQDNHVYEPLVEKENDNLTYFKDEDDDEYESKRKSSSDIDAVEIKGQHFNNYKNK